MPIHKNKITFISITADTLDQDFKAIDEELRKRCDFDIHYNLIVFKKTLKDDFLYMLNCIKQLYEVNTSKLIILNDNNFVVTRFKRKGTYVLQTWHASGAIKKFGNQIERSYPIKNYDVVLSNSVYWIHAYSEAFGVNHHQVLISGMPRVDKLCDRTNVNDMRHGLLKKYPQLKDAYVVLYAPTFRGNIIHGLRHDTIDMGDIISKLPKHYVVLYKMHPLLQDVSLGETNRLINVFQEDLYTLLCACDCLISDYSSILFDYSLLHKKMICYASDYEEYEQNIGFNVSYQQEMPCDICVSEDELLSQLKDPSFSKQRLEEFQDKFMPFRDGNNTKRVVDEIIKLMK